MNALATDPMAGLRDDLDSARVHGEKADAPKFPCMSCAGTGKYQGVRRHQISAECFSCKGRGYFKKSAPDRAKARASAANRKARALAEAQASFSKAHPGLIERAQAAASWHSFASEMMGNFAKYGSLTARQAAALASSLDRADAGIARKRAEREKASGAVDIAKIDALFAKAQSSGLRSPCFRTPEVTLSLAKPYSRNPGAIYVKGTRDDMYFGKIIGGRFEASRDATSATLETLRMVAENPIVVARAYAASTKQEGAIDGRCSCCGLPLTNPESVAAGIGPICAKKWGL